MSKFGLSSPIVYAETYYVMRIVLPFEIWLLGIGTIIISLLFYTFEALLVFCAFYLASIPFSFFTHRYKSKKEILQTSDEEHEDVL